MKVIIGMFNTAILAINIKSKSSSSLKKINDCLNLKLFEPKFHRHLQTFTQRQYHTEPPGTQKQ